MYITLRAEIFADRNFRGIYFDDFGPKSRTEITRNLLELAQSRKFVPRNSQFLDLPTAKISVREN